MLTDFFNGIYSAVASLTFETALYICWGAFALVFVCATLLTIFNSGVRAANKRPYLAFVNIFTAVTFALALTERELDFSVLVAAVFWCAGYLTYGFIVLLSRRKTRAAQNVAMPEFPPPALHFKSSAAPANANVRTEHALSVTEKLLSKELGRGDRQEAERIKSFLSFMQAKGSLTPEDNERLNDNFNTLLKLMAKYKM